MRTMSARLTLLFAIFTALVVATPAAATTKCLCNNGKVINSTRKGEHGCNSACKILGGGGRVWTPEDQVLDDDGGAVVRPRRSHGPAHRRR